MSGAAPVVMIYRLGSMGDTIVAMPAMRLVARAFPESKRVLLTNVSVSAKAASPFEMLAATGLVQDCVEYPLKMRAWRDVVLARRRIRAVAPEVLVYLAPARGWWEAVRDALFFRLCGVRKIIGVPYARRLRACQPVGGGMFEYEGARLMRCLAALGDYPIDESAFDLCLTPAEVLAADEALGPLGGSKILAFSIGAKIDVKDWGEAKWRELLARLSARFADWGLVALGAGVERERSEGLMDVWGGATLNLCGVLSVRVSAAVLARAAVFLGHDSGPMHLAASVGTPCVAVFSSRNLPGEWFPQGARHRIIYHAIGCQGCRLFECVTRGKACINSIGVDEVFDAVVGVASQVSASFFRKKEAKKLWPWGWGHRR